MELLSYGGIIVCMLFIFVCIVCMLFIFVYRFILLMSVFIHVDVLAGQSREGFKFKYSLQVSSGQPLHACLAEAKLISISKASELFLLPHISHQVLFSCCQLS